MNEIKHTQHQEYYLAVELICIFRVNAIYVKLTRFDIENHLNTDNVDTTNYIYLFRKPLQLICK